MTSGEKSDLNLDFDQPLLFNIKRLLRKLSFDWHSGSYYVRKSKIASYFI